MIIYNQRYNAKAPEGIESRKAHVPAEMPAHGKVAFW